MPEWVIWVVAAALLAGGEVLTMGFFLGPIAIAAAVAAIVAAAGAGIEIQFIVFIAGSIASLAFIRPYVRDHIPMPAPTRTNAARLVGHEALVLERVDRDGGRVKIGGEEWTARSTDPDVVHEPGDRVEVMQIEGATARVASTN